MDPVVESALISAAATLVGVGGTAAVAIAGFRFSRRTLEDTRDEMIADRYTKAIEQLGSGQLDVRIGAIYALERVARDSVKDHPTVMEVVSAFIREHSQEAWPEPDPLGREREPSIRPDVQAAVTVVARRDPGRDIHPIDLAHAQLREVNLSGVNLARVILSAANLWAANMTGVNLTGANLSGANLTGAVLTSAHLAGADLTNADLTGAILRGANLTNADLGGKHQSAEDFYDGYDLFSARVIDTDLTNARLDGACWPRNTAVPAGWRLDADSHRLKRAGDGRNPMDPDGP